MLERRDPLAPGFVAAVGMLSMTALMLAVSLLVDPLVPYLAFGPSQAWPSVLLVAMAGVVGGAVALALRRLGAGRAVRRVVLALVALLALVACYRVGRAFIASGVAVPGAVKAAIALALLGVAAWIAWQPAPRARRTIEAILATTLAGVLVHPAGLGRLLLGPSYAGAASAGHAGAAAPAHAPMPAVTPGGGADAGKGGTPAAGAAPGAPRVVVLLLDELDSGLAGPAGFLERSGLSRGPVYVAQHARPAGENTIVAVPSMLQGRAFGRIVDARRGRLRGEGGTVWRAGEPSLFTDVLDRGGRLAVRGFYHDYCAIVPPRAIGGAASHAAAGATPSSDCLSIPLTHPGDASDVLRALLPLPPMRLRSVTGEDATWRDLYARLATESLDVVARSDADLMWLHVNAPHPPSVVAGADPALDTSLERAYDGNLSVAAALVARIRGILRARGERHVLIVTSDHGLRIRSVWRTLYAGDAGLESLADRADGRVPFIVAFPGDGDRFDDLRSVSMLSLRAVVDGLLREDLRTPADVAAAMQVPEAGGPANATPPSRA